MKKYKKYLIMLTLASLLSGCSTNDVPASNINESNVASEIDDESVSTIEASIISSKVNNKNSSVIEESIVSSKEASDIEPIVKSDDITDEIEKVNFYVKTSDDEDFDILRVVDCDDNNYILENNMTIPKNKAIRIYDDTFVVVDISDQNLKVIDSNEIVLDTPVVTGKPKSPTPIGDFNVFEESHNRDLIGSNYRSPITVMEKFVGNVGLHDAEIWVNPDGRKVGWRKSDEFGGEIYKTRGSHGCVNMPHEAALTMDEYVGEKTRVLVKK